MTILSDIFWSIMLITGFLPTLLFCSSDREDYCDKSMRTGFAIWAALAFLIVWLTYRNTAP